MAQPVLVKPTEGGPDPSQLIDLFCRKSKAKASRTGKREISVSAQEKRGRLIAAQLGLTVRHVWREVGSASRFSTRKAREDQDNALKALERREVGALWVYRLDRWDRTGAGAVLRIIEPEDGLTRRLLIDNGDPDNPGIGLDSTNPRDREELIRQAERARAETDLLSERVRATKTYQLMNGEWLGAAPYGYRVVIVEKEDEDGELVEERKLELDSASAGDPKDPKSSKAEMARKAVYTLPMSGTSPDGIVASLNTRGVPSPTGGAWSRQTVRAMMKHPVYAGWQTKSNGGWNRSIVRNEAGEKLRVVVGPTVITEAERLEVLELIENPASSPRPELPRDTRKHRLLTDLTKCANCGGSMPSRGNSYACVRPRGARGCPAPLACTTHSLERWVTDRWFARITNADADDPLMYAVAERWAAKVAPEATADSKAAVRALEQAEAALAQVWADRRAGNYAGPSAKFFNSDVAAANEAVTAAQAALTDAVGRRSVDIGWLSDPETCQEAWEAADPATRRTLLRLAVERITVYPAPKKGGRFDGWGRVRIAWVDGQEDPDPTA